MQKTPLSVCLMVKNEERHLAACLDAVRWADEIVIVDSFSTDKTVEIARRYTDRVVQREWAGNVKQREFSMSLAKNEWVLCLDGDEVVNEEMAADIQRVVTQNDPSSDGFVLRRVNVYLGRPLWYGGQVDKQLRLARRSKAKVVGDDPHDRIAVPGHVGVLRGFLMHTSFDSIQEQLERTERYSEVQLKAMLAKGERHAFLKMVTHPLLMFAKNYLLRAGFLDGTPGLIWAGMNAFYIFVKYAKLHRALHEKKRVQGSGFRV